MGLVIRRSDVFPVGTVVKAYPEAAADRRREGKPSGASLATATVAADGSLSFPTVIGTRVVLHAEVGGVPTLLHASAEPFTPPTTLIERVRARRRLAGV